MFRTTSLISAIALAAMPTGALASGKTPDNATSLSTTTYFQDFDTLATSGTSNTSLPAGFQIVETDDGSRADGDYAAGTGSSNTGDAYSFGASGSTERALGSVGSGSNDEIFFGAVFFNDLDAVITALNFDYIGEQWRAGNSSNDGLTFQFSTDATALDNGSWLDIAGLGFAPLVTSGTTALDGNATSTAISGMIDGLTISEGSSFGFRWLDVNSGGSDHGLAVDNLSFTATVESAGAVPEPSTWALMVVGLAAAGGAMRRRKSGSVFAAA